MDYVGSQATYRVGSRGHIFDNQGYHSGSPNNEDYSWGSILGVPFFNENIHESLPVGACQDPLVGYKP